MTLALRVGLILLLISLAAGMWMIIRGTAADFPPAMVGAKGSLKGAHAVGMHGIQVLCALAWAVSFAPVTEQRRTRLVALGAVGYGVAAVGALVLAGAGRGPALEVGTAMVGIIALGCLGAAGEGVVAALRGTQPRTVTRCRRPPAREPCRPRWPARSG